MTVGTSIAPLALTFIIGGLIAMFVCAVVYTWGKKTKNLDEKQRIEVLKYGVYSFMALAIGLWFIWLCG